MRSLDLVHDYISRAAIRLKAIETLYSGKGYADVVRESQEVVELTLQALLRACDIAVPRVHDVSDIIRENRSRRSPACRAAKQRCMQLRTFYLRKAAVPLHRADPA
jgi:HEPN domain-containing protein